MRTDVEVLCGVSAPSCQPSATRLRLRLSGSGKNITLMHDIPKGLVTNLPPVLSDLMEVATYVHCADHATARGGDGVVDYGARWRRHFRFHIAVREPSVWASPAVLSVLERTLSFLSDDDYSFCFAQNSHPTPVQRYFHEAHSENVRPDYDKVILFSGGLDSLAGAADLLIRSNTPTVLVSHRGSRKLDPRIRRLVRLLDARSGSTRLLHLPVRIEKKQQLSREYTQRTRSFLYASLAATTAHAIGLGGIHFFENGVVSFNLPLSAQVIGARATRTTHPEALKGFEELFSILVGRRFTVDNPFLWMTKADVIRIIVESGCADLIRYSNSCSRTFAMTRLHSHCGICSQCIDRRFGALGAGAERFDPEEMYGVKLMTDARSAGEARTMAECYVRTASEMSSMTEREFLTRFGEVARIARALPGKADDNVRRIYDLHVRHAECVTRVIDNAIAQHATEVRQGTLPESCVIALSLPQSKAGDVALASRAQKRSTAKGDDDSDEQSIRGRASELIKDLQDISPGPEAAGVYHKTVLEIVRVLFWPRLSLPKNEKEINEGRKRIDIVCRNTNQENFFSDLRNVYEIHCPFILFECKNYSEDPGNPEFDQLSGRFGREQSGRGRFGVLACRTVDNKEEVKRHCRDRIQDRGEYILVLDDRSIVELLTMRAEGKLSEMDEMLHSLFEEIFV